MVETWPDLNGGGIKKFINTFVKALDSWSRELVLVGQLTLRGLEGEKMLFHPIKTPVPPNIPGFQSRFCWFEMGRGVFFGGKRPPGKMEIYGNEGCRP